MTLTLYPESVVLTCDHPDCRNDSIAAGAGDARSPTLCDSDVWPDYGPHNLRFR